MNNVELDDELLDPVSGVMSPAPTELTLAKGGGRVAWSAEMACRIWIWSLRTSDQQQPQM